MGSKKPSNSTRLSKARFVKSAPIPGCKPAGVERLAKGELPITALREIRTRLNLINSTAMVVGHALREQNVLLDGHAADVLRRHVSDLLFVQILKINNLLGEKDDDADDGGAV